MRPTKNPKKFALCSEVKIAAKGIFAPSKTPKWDYKEKSGPANAEKSKKTEKKLKKVEKRY